MRKLTLRITATLMALTMVMGMLVLLPLSASAESPTVTAPAIAVEGAVDIWDGVAVSESLAGAGTAENPFLIQSAADFVYFATVAASAATAGQVFHLTTNVDMNSQSIGTDKRSFAGVLEGNGKVVDNLQITPLGQTAWNSTSAAVLFNTLTGTIQNISFDNYMPVCHVKATSFVDTMSSGALIDNVEINIQNYSKVNELPVTATGVAMTVAKGATIRNAVVMGDLRVQRAASSTARLFGGIAGNCNGTIDNGDVYATLTLTGGEGTDFAAGVVNYLHDGTVKNCDFYGTFINKSTKTGNNNGISGVIGKAMPHVLNNPSFKILIDNCNNYGTVDASGSTGSRASGIVDCFGPDPWNNNAAKTGAFTITNCANYGEILANDYFAGGISAWALRGRITMKDCFNYGKVSVVGTAANAVAGGLVGNWEINAAGTARDVQNCGNFGEVYGAKTGHFFGMDAQSGMTTVMRNMVSYAKVGVESASPALATVYSADIAASEDKVATLNTYAIANDYTPWIQGADAPVPVTMITPSGATMSLGSTMQLNIKLSADEIANLVEVAGENDKTVSVAIKNASEEGKRAPLAGGYYTASYETLASELHREMSLRVVISVGTEQYESHVATAYSPLTYALNTYEAYKDTDDALAELLTNMMYYGAAAETNKHGTQHTLDVLTEKGFTAPAWDDFTDHINETAAADKDKINAIAGTGATLTGGIDITFLMNDGYTTLTVNGKTYTADADGRIVFDGITAGNILTVFSLTFSGEGVDTVTASFTVGNFLESRRANADETALAEATILYMMAARAYVLATQA